MNKQNEKECRTCGRKSEIVSLDTICPFCNPVQDNKGTWEQRFDKQFPQFKERETYFFEEVPLPTAIKSFIANEIEKSYKLGSWDGSMKATKIMLEQTIPSARKTAQEEVVSKIPMLRQWLNEDRITDPQKMVTNEEIKHWFNLSASNE